MPRLKQEEDSGIPIVWVSSKLLSRGETLDLCSSDALNRKTILHSSLHSHVQLGWVSADGNEAHYVQPECDGTGGICPKTFSFVAFRFEKYQGREVLLSWCSSDRCSGHESRKFAQAVSRGAKDIDSLLKGKDSLSLHCKKGKLNLRWRGGGGDCLEWGRVCHVGRPSGFQQRAPFMPLHNQFHR